MCSESTNAPDELQRLCQEGQRQNGRGRGANALRFGQTLGAQTALKPRERAKCAPATMVENKKPGHGPRVFKEVQQLIMDIGSGVDLVTKSDVAHASKHFENAGYAMEFNTANGKTTTTEVIQGYYASTQ